MKTSSSYYKKVRYKCDFEKAITERFLVQISLPKSLFQIDLNRFLFYKKTELKKRVKSAN